MIQATKTLAMTVLLVAVRCNLGLGQAPPVTILQIDMENTVQYRGDVSDPSKLATQPNAVPATIPRNFEEVQLIADIVAVNGQPAKGTRTADQRLYNLTTAPSPGQAISDTVRTATVLQTFEILSPDGTAIGSIFVVGAFAGAPPPGAPLSTTGGNNAIVGGTGAFLGARGQAGPAGANTARQASMAEDPANRRLNGGGAQRWVLHVIPMSIPQVVSTPAGPAVTHSSDFSLVSAAKPAAAGEVLSVFMTGLGPTRPGVDPGQPFPVSPPAVVNSPVDVKVNGKSAEVLAAVGFPGTVDGYQVNVRVPSDTAKGTATIQVSAAWISGTPVNITIQ